MAEAVAIADFVGRGFDVYAPAFGNATCDFIVQAPDGSLKRVEVKSTSTLLKSGKYQVQLRSVRSNKTKSVVKKFDSSKCDYLVVYIVPERSLVILDAKDFDGRSTIDVSVHSEPS